MTTQEEAEDVFSDLMSEQINAHEMAENGWGNGPYVMDDISDSSIVGTLYEDHPAAEYIELPRFELHVADGERTQLLQMQGEIDILSGIYTEDDLETMTGDLPEHFDQVSIHESTYNDQFLFNWQNPHLARRGVRRAIVTAIDLPNMFLNADMPAEAAAAREYNYQTNLAESIARQYIDDDVMESLYRYPPESDYDLAAEFMEDAGYTLEDDEWVHEDGEVAEVILHSTTWDNYVVWCETVRSQLSDFGFRTELQTMEDNAYYDRIGNNTYEIGPYWLEFNDVPWNIFRVTPNQWGPTTIRDVPGYDYGEVSSADELDADTDVQGRPLVTEIPEEPGALDLSGGSIEIDLIEIFEDLSDPETSEERRAEGFELCARWYNFDVPDWRHGDGSLDGWAGNVRDFDFPEGGAAETDATRGSNERYLVQSGTVLPRYE